MATSLGVRIGIEGGKDFIDEVRRITSETKALKAAFEDVSKLKDPFEKAGSQTEILTEAIKKGEEKLRVYNDQLQKATQKYGENSGQANRWREEISKANIELQNLKDTLSKISTQSVEIKGLGTFKRDMETMTTAASAFRSEFKNFENLSGLSNVFTKSSGMKSSLTSEIKAQEEVVKLLADDYEKAARESGAFSAQALELRGKLADATTELRNMQQELKELPNGLMLAADEIQKTGEKVYGFGSAFTDASKALAPLSGTAMAGLVGIGKSASSYEHNMKRVESVVGVTAKSAEDLAAQMESIDASIMQMESIYAKSELAAGMEDIVRAGFSGDDSLKMFTATLNVATIEEMDMASAATGLAQSVKQFGDGAEDASRYADVLAATSAASATNLSELLVAMSQAAPAANAAGASVEDVSLLLGLMANNGIVASRSGTAVKNMFSNLMNPTDKAAEKLEKFGVSLFDLNGNLRPVPAVITDIRKNFSGLAGGVVNLSDEVLDSEEAWEAYTESLPVSDQERLAAIVEVFGKRALPGVLAVINTAEDKYNDLATAINTSSGAAQKMADVITSSTDSQWKIFINEIKTLAIELGRVLLPVLKDIIGIAKEWIQGFRGMDDSTKKTILTVMGGLALVSPILGGIGSIFKGIGSIISLSGTLVGGIGRVIRLFTGAGGLVPAMASVAQGATGAGGVVSSLTSVGTTVGAGSTGLVGKLGGLAKAAGPFLLKGAIVVGIAAGAVWLGKKIYEHWDDIKAFLSETWNAIKDMASDIWDGIKNVIGDVWSGVKTVAVETWEGVTTFLSESWNGIKTLAGDAWSGLTTVISDGWNGIKTITSGIWNGLTTFLSETWGGIKTVAGDMWDGLKTVISDGWTAIKVFTTSIWDGIKGFLSDTWNGIKTLASDLFNGIATVISDIWTGVKNFTSTTWNGITTFLGDTWNGLKIVAGDTFNGIAQGISDAWQGVKYAGEVIWNGIKGFLGDLWGGLKTLGIDIFSGLAQGLSDIWDGIKYVAESAWEGIKGIIGDVWNGVKGLAEDIAGEFVGIGNSLETAIQNVKTQAGNAWAESIMSNEDTRQAASDMMSNFKNGVKSGKKGAVGAIKGFATDINELLHHSTPDKGPLKDDDTWMPDMMMQFAKGIRDYIPEIQKASRQAAAAMVPSHYAYLPEPGSVNTSTVNMGGITIPIHTQPGQDPEEIAAVVERRLTNMIARQQYAYS